VKQRNIKALASAELRPCYLTVQVPQQSKRVKPSGAAWPSVSFQAVPPCPNCIGAPLNPRSESGHVATTPERRIVTRSRQLVYANLIWSDLIVRD